MELIPFSGRRWRRRRRGYNRLSSPTKPRTARFGSASWRLRLAPKLRLMRLASSAPLKLWGRFKNAYMKMMIGFANTTGTSNVFGDKRIPQARAAAPMARSRADFENRLLIEIYKSMVASLELGYNK